MTLHLHQVEHGARNAAISTAARLPVSAVVRAIDITVLDLDAVHSELDAVDSIPPFILLHDARTRDGSFDAIIAVVLAIIDVQLAIFIADVLDIQFGNVAGGIPVHVDNAALALASGRTSRSSSRR